MKPLTRFSVTATLALVTLGAVAITCFTSGGAMFSPGPLNSVKRGEVARNGVHSHAELSNNCAACHAAPWSRQKMASLCQDCHVEVRREIEAGQPLHGKLTDVQSCRKCHSEHNGALAELTSFAHFDHNATAFPLTGKHQAVVCAQCHIEQKFQGTAQTCVGCHADPPVHKGRFGENCASCHTTSTWKGAKFAHEFPLNHGGGKQKNQDCAICHTKPGDYKAYTCYGCHKHEPFKTAKKHERLKIANLDDCFACHPGGRKRRDQRPKKDKDALLEFLKN